MDEAVQRAEMAEKLVGEEELGITANDFNKATEEQVVSLEMIYFPRNHKLIYYMLHKDWWTLRHLWANVTREIRYYYEAKRWYRGDAEDISKFRGRGPVVICASGPTFDQEAPLLKDWAGDVWCNMSQASTLIYYGRHPTIAHIADPRQPEVFLHAPWDLEKTAWAMRPEVHPRCVDYWHGKTYFYRIEHPGFDFYNKVIMRSFLEAYLDKDGNQQSRNLLPTRSVPFGCSLTTMIGHTPYVGYDKIFLCGTSFGDRWGEQDRFTDYRWTKGPHRWSRWRWEKHAAHHIGDSPIDKAHTVNLSGTDGLMLRNNTLYYRNHVMRPLALDAPQIFNCSHSTIPEECIPKVDIKKVIATNGECAPIREREEIRWQAERFLARRTYYLIPRGDTQIDSKGRYRFDSQPTGWRFISMRKPEDELPHIMTLLEKDDGNKTDLELVTEHTRKLAASLGA